MTLNHVSQRNATAAVTAQAGCLEQQESLRLQRSTKKAWRLKYSDTDQKNAAMYKSENELAKESLELFIDENYHRTAAQPDHLCKACPKTLRLAQNSRRERALQKILVLASICNLSTSSSFWSN